MTADRPPLASGTLDRDAATRLSPERLEAAWNEPGAQVLRLRGAEVPVQRGADGRTRLALVAAEVLGGPFAAEHERVFLGRVSGAPVFAVPWEAAFWETVAADAQGTVEEWASPMSIAAELDDTERELVAVSLALIRWHEASLFSPLDGSETRPAYGGWARLDARGTELFPRTDPAVIVLIEHEDRVLLGSNALWDTGRFSLLAGFVEAGESLEQAVFREVFEESGVRLGDIEYVTSQPWPFPRSLMLGFRARLAAGVDPDDLSPDPEEISELRWFSRDELRDPPPGVTLPGSLSIARWMIDRWAAEVDRGGA